MSEQQQLGDEVFDVDAEISRRLEEFDEQERQKRERWVTELSTRLDACLPKLVQNALNIVPRAGNDRAYATITRYGGNPRKSFRYAISYLETDLWQIRRVSEDGSIIEGNIATDSTELLDSLLLYIGRTERGD